MPFLLAKNVRGDFPHRRTLTTEYSVSKDTFSNGCKKASTAGAAAMITIYSWSDKLRSAILIRFMRKLR